MGARSIGRIESETGLRGPGVGAPVISGCSDTCACCGEIVLGFDREKRDLQACTSHAKLVTRCRCRVVVLLGPFQKFYLSSHVYYRFQSISSLITSPLSIGNRESKSMDPNKIVLRSCLFSS